MIKDFRKTKKICKKIKNGQFSFFDILKLPHTVISNSEKLTHPNVHNVSPCPYTGAHTQTVNFSTVQYSTVQHSTVDVI